MAQSARDAKVENRTTRLRLKTGLRHFKSIGEGLSLIYRRTGDGYGTWSAKLALRGGKYAVRAIGTADDYQDANGVDVLTFHQAQAKMRGLSEDAKVAGGVLVRPTTVREACERYLAWFRENRKGTRMAESAVRTWIMPTLGDIMLSDLTATRLRDWLEAVASKPARLRTGKSAKKINHRPAPKTVAEKKSRKSSANRVWSVLRAILNRAHEDGFIVSNAGWATVKAYRNVDEARIRFLSEAEARRLLNACPPDLRALVRGALLTGMRRGELASLKVSDVDLNGARVYVAESKSDRPRYVPLNPEGLEHFREVVTGKTGGALVFTRADGIEWGHNYHVRALTAACDVAKVTPMVSFHELRHTYAASLANAGVDLQVISKLLGHADTRITMRHYAHLTDKTLEIAVLKLPTFAKEPKDTVRAVA
jgi:integrase